MRFHFEKQNKTVTGFINSVPLFEKYSNTRSAGHLYCVSSLSSSLGIVTFIESKKRKTKLSLFACFFLCENFLGGAFSIHMTPRFW